MGGILVEKALVIGGTRFFGVHLVKSLLDMGVHVTVATRGMAADPFGDEVERIFFDRSDLTNFKESFKDTKWDAVYDQICYSSEDALNAIEVFSGKTEHYILTSTLSVYDSYKQLLKEEDFNPYEYPIVIKSAKEVTYQEGKRQAEAVFFQKAPFKTAAVRIPIVLGINDYTKRLEFHTEKVAAGEEIYFPNIQAAMGFIDEKEAGNFIAWAGVKGIEGPVNACADGIIHLSELIAIIEKSTGKQAVLANEKQDNNASPYGIDSFWAMSNDKAKGMGYLFSNLQEWLPSLINSITKK
ncbi:NAD-dependent epimerase/dehydratase family protein [Bacillus sp. Au-Bac7]|uniref:NAD-dependent epimerase/dehydratase family protein n=1 Tax=Bacillus sp. Au-Bac7 TaxID=2906458 RepID=UPI001E3B0C52|nr:NAD-dependent epimerase/dehydratase family protein [Bacillus sp. Au-Bac7]MCE4051331.1 NAD-dependent epimerase/dehydratase family protein [Bacillus sp. Au-Bac7]